MPVLPSAVPRPVRRPLTAPPRALAIALASALALALPLPLGLAISPAHAAPTTVHDVPLPRGSRSLSTDVFISGQTFRKTVDQISRWLTTAGLAHEAVPIYRYRGVDVARFLSNQPTTAWLAVHIFRHQGKTLLTIVPRPVDTPLTPAPGGGR